MKKIKNICRDNILERKKGVQVLGHKINKQKTTANSTPCISFFLHDCSNAVKSHHDQGILFKKQKNHYLEFAYNFRVFVRDHLGGECGGRQVSMVLRAYI